MAFAPGRLPADDAKPSQVDSAAVAVFPQDRWREVQIAGGIEILQGGDAAVGREVYRLEDIDELDALLGLWLGRGTGGVAAATGERTEDECREQQEEK